MINTLNSAHFNVAKYFFFANLVLADVCGLCLLWYRSCIYLFIYTKSFNRIYQNEYFAI